MAHASVLARSLGSSPAQVRPAVSPARRSLWARFLDAMIESRTRQAEREVERLVALRGGKFTDDVEREIERSFTRVGSF